MAAPAAEIEDSLSRFNRKRLEDRHAPRGALGPLSNLALPQTDITAEIQGLLLQVFSPFGPCMLQVIRVPRVFRALERM
jgi:hypothetical protein